MLRALLAPPLLGLVLLSCAGKDDPSPEESAAPSDTGEGGADTGPPEPPSEDPCERALSGAAAEKSAAIALSEAHADLRLFGEAADFPSVDEALVAALAGAGPEAPDLDAYVAVAGGCAAEAAAEGLGAAEVSLVGALAWVRPGTGEVALPEGAAGVVIDLRGLPEVDGLGAALAAALAPAIAAEVAMPVEELRRWNGFVDQVYSSSNVYKTRIAELELAPVAPAGAAELPVVLVTDARTAPTAVRFAAGLAMAGRAWIVGEDLLTVVGELQWSPIGERGLLWRARRLLWEDEPVPDRLPAALRTADPEGALAGVDLASWAGPALPDGEATRGELPDRSPFSEAAPPEGGEAERFAAGLLVAHGVLRRFGMYFDVVGDGIDARLEELLAAPPAAEDRAAMRRALGRLGQVLEDGHVFFGDLYDDGPTGYMPVVFDHVDGRPVVVRSGDAGLAAGDTVLAVDGVDIEDVYADYLEWHGAATEGYALDLAMRELRRMDRSKTLTLRAADGSEREVVVEPAPLEELYALPWVFQPRESGLLDDLGSPGIAYLNLDYEVTASLDRVEELLALAAGATGLVVDMRGYPGVNNYTVAELLREGDFASPAFANLRWTGPDLAELEESQYELVGSGDWSGPIALLISPVTVSAAENFAMMLVDDERVHVVGRTSAGTNGNMTGLLVPGGFYLTFTGMRVLFPDGSTFHGVGIQPELEVAPTAADYAEGRDPELEAAVALLESL